jgi:hypothetical protein
VNTGHAPDLEVAVAVEMAAQAGGDVAQCHVQRL